MLAQIIVKKISENIKNCVFYDQIIVVELHGHKRVFPNKKLRCEKHFFIKAGKGIMNKRGVNTGNNNK